MLRAGIEAIAIAGATVSFSFATPMWLGDVLMAALLILGEILALAVYLRLGDRGHEVRCDTEPTT